jgi:polar amino acid transport system substrate-binding protein
VKPPAWLRLPAVLLMTAAIAAWAVPGSAAVTTRPAQHPARSAAAAAATSCDPTASLRPAGPPQVAPGSFMAKIRARGYLIAGVDQNTYHFGYLNPLDGKIEGFDIDMVRAVAKAIFGNPNKVVFKAISDDQRIPDVRSGAVDIVAHTMTINCERLKEVDFSTVYFDAGQRVLVEANSPAKSLADLAISQQHPDFVRFVNAVLQQLRTDGQWAASYAHWVGTPVPAPPPAHYKA